MRSCSGVGFQNILSGNDIPGGEMLEHHTRQRPDIQRVQFYNISRLFSYIVLRLPYCIGTLPLPFPG